MSMWTEHDQCFPVDRLHWPHTFAEGQLQTHTYVHPPTSPLLPEYLLIISLILYLIILIIFIHHFYFLVINVTELFLYFLKILLDHEVLGYYLKPINSYLTILLLNLILQLLILSIFIFYLIYILTTIILIILIIIILIILIIIILIILIIIMNVN